MTPVTTAIILIRPLFRPGVSHMLLRCTVPELGVANHPALLLAAYAMLPAIRGRIASHGQALLSDPSEGRIKRLDLFLRRKKEACECDLKLCFFTDCQFSPFSAFLWMDSWNKEKKRNKYSIRDKDNK